MDLEQIGYFLFMSECEKAQQQEQKQEQKHEQEEQQTEEQK